jgi:hypothetical protein
LLSSFFIDPPESGGEWLARPAIGRKRINYC